MSAKEYYVKMINYLTNVIVHWQRQADADTRAGNHDRAAEMLANVARLESRRLDWLDKLENPRFTDKER